MRRELLATILLDQEGIDPRFIQAAVKETRARKISFERALLQMEDLPQEPLRRALETQRRERLVTALGWPEGGAAFYPPHRLPERLAIKPGDDPIGVFAEASRRHFQEPDLLALFEPLLHLRPDLHGPRSIEPSKLGYGPAEETFVGLLDPSETLATHVEMLEDTTERSAFLRVLLTLVQVGAVALAD